MLATPMSCIPGMSRDVGRGQLPGISVPYMDIELDEAKVRLSDEDVRNGFRSVCGRINISPASTKWYDGTLLVLTTLNLVVTSSPRPGQNPQQDTFFETCTLDLMPARVKRYDPAIPYDSTIQFGSKMADANGTLCPFAIRVPASAFVLGGKRELTFCAKAMFVRTGPAGPTAPAQFEVSSNPIVANLIHR